MRLLLMALILSFASLSLAQETLKTADEYFKKQDYEKALQHLQIILSSEQLKGDERCFAYLLKAKTHLNLLDRAVKNNDVKNIEKYKEAYFNAYQDLLDAKKYMQGDKAKKECEALGIYLNRSINRVGAGILNKIYSDSKMESVAKNTALDEAQKYLMASISLNPKDYSAYDLYGQVMMLKKADDDALLNFEKSEKYFLETKQKETDFGHFRIYGNMAIIQLKRKQSSAALGHIEKGKNSLDKYFQGFNSSNEAIKKEYLDMKSVLDAIENDIYLNSPDLSQKAIEKFSNIRNAKPADISSRLILAQLFEQNKQTKEAAAEYESVLKIDSTNRLTLYNLGILYLNEAIETEAKISTEKPEANLKSKMTNALQRSETLLKRALGPEEKDIDCIDALLKIYGRLQKKEEYQYYRNLKTALLQSK